MRCKPCGVSLGLDVLTLMETLMIMKIMVNKKIQMSGQRADEKMSFPGGGLRCGGFHFRGVSA